MSYIEHILGVKVKSPQTIVVTTSDVKAEILKYRTDNKIIDNIKLMTAKEFETAFIFNSNIECLNHLIKNSPWSNQELDVEVAIQLEQALLIINQLNIKEHPLYSYLQNLKTLGYFNQLSSLPNYQIITHLPTPSDLIMTVTSLNSIVHSITNTELLRYNYFLDEIEAAIEYIMTLVDNGTSLDNIHFLAPSNYHTHIKQVASLYNLPLKSENKIKVLSHPDGNRALDAIISGDDLDLQTIEPLFVEPIVEVVNKYAKYSKLDCAKLIAYDFTKMTAVASAKAGLEIKSKIDSLYTNVNFEQDHFILLGNYQDGLVTYAKDTNIVGDQYRHQLLTTDIQNQLADSNLYNIINNAKNLRISYATKLVDTSVSVANNLSKATIEPMAIDKQNQYSRAADNLRYARANYIKQTFNMDTVDYITLNNHFNIEMKSNTFNHINREYESLQLSYTSINDYYKCSYKFYLGHILRIKNGKFDDRKVIVGNIVHYVLENIDKFDDLTKENILNIIANYIKEKEIQVTAIDQIYFNKFSIYLEAVCTYMKQEEADCGYSKIEREQGFEMKLSDNISLVGKIDKILSKIEDDNLFVEIYDYKTGSLSIDVAGIEYGLNMQNLVYFLLLKDYYKHEQGDEILVGTFQHQIKQKLLYDEQELLDTMKIKGFSQLKHDNFFKRTEKIISSEEIELLLEKTEEKVLAAATDINQSKFTINPKIIKGKNESCGYCQYASICNKTQNDFEYLN